MSKNLFFGILFVVTGCISLIGYITKNEKFFAKKKWFKDVWGEKVGTILHFVSYAIVPICLGIYLLIFR